MPRFLPAALLVALAPASAFAQRDAKIPDPDPEIERQSFQVAAGVEVTLYAADPLLNKPIQINFDPQGRLWVASSATYPQIKPGETANDRIIVLEDTDKDGKADRTTVFADGLLIPTGVVPGDGGAYVANSTELVHLSASVPGGKADRRKVLLSGFGTEDTHHILHTLRWGYDGHLYMNQSIYTHTHIETVHGVRRLNSAGIWRFNPDFDLLIPIGYDADIPQAKAVITAITAAEARILREPALAALHTQLRERFGIVHLTIQIEQGRDGDCQTSFS